MDWGWGGGGCGQEWPLRKTGVPPDINSPALWAALCLGGLAPAEEKRKWGRGGHLLKVGAGSQSPSQED